MIKYLLLTLISLNAIAKNYIVEIADFNCKYCLEAENLNYKIKNTVKENGDEFVFAPFTPTGKNFIKELVYYSIKHDKKLEDKLRPIMFDLAQVHRIPMATIPELIDWIAINYNPKNIDPKIIMQHIKEKSKKSENVISLLKTSKLAKDMGVTQTPTYIIVTENAEKIKVNRPKGMSLKEYIQMVIDTYEGAIKK